MSADGRADTATGSTSSSVTTRSRASGAGCGKTSLDELPQLLQRPARRHVARRAAPVPPVRDEHFAPHHFERFLVPPGLTGLWQVTARAHSTFGEALDMDVAYVRGWSLGLDLWLLLPDAAADLPSERDRVISRSARRRPGVVRRVVGLGYWGPNLVRNLHELAEVEVV